MADDLSLIVPIGAELSGLAQGITEAKVALSQFEAQANSIAKSSAEKIKKAFSGAAQPYSLAGQTVSPDMTTKPYELAEDAVKKVGTAAEDTAKKTAAVGAEAKKANETFKEMGRLTAAVGKGLVVAQTALGTIKIVSAAIKGDFDGINEAVDNFPLLGGLAKDLRPLLEGALGVDASQFSESLGEARRQMGLLKAETAAVHALNMEAAEFRIMAARTDNAAAKENAEQEARQFEIRAKYQQMLDDARRSGFANGKTEAQILAEYRMEWDLSIIESNKRVEEANRREKEKTQQEEERRMDEQIRANADAAAKITENRKKAREKAYRDEIDAIRRENEERQQQVDAAREELSEVSKVRGSNFVQRSSTALGSFSSAQSGAAATVARAAQRQVDLQIQIRDLVAKIQSEQKAAQMIGEWN